MEISPQTVRTLFLNLDEPSGLPAPPAAKPLSVNSHIHLPPNFSAFDSVKQAVRLAADQGIDALGASNYYDYSVYGEFAAQAASRGIFPLFGIEIIVLIEELARAGVKINDPGNPGKMYLCGKGITAFDPMSPEAASLLGAIRSRDSERMARMTDRLAELFREAGLETGLDETAVTRQIVQRHGSPIESVYLQERHVAQAFQEVLFDRVPEGRRGEILGRLFGIASKAPDDAPGVQSEIRSHLMKAGKPAYVEETFVGFDHAYRLILALGGIPCYPTLADGGGEICPFETPVERLIESIKERGITAAELIPVRNSPEVLGHYVRSMRAAGLIVTAGTEHNTREMLPIEPSCVGGQPIPDDVMEIFREGACVVAAHQYLSFRDEAGFVDRTGRPNPAYSSAGNRITAFRDIGAAAIHAFRLRRPS